MAENIEEMKKGHVETYRADKKALRSIIDALYELPPLDALEVIWHIKQIAKADFKDQIIAAADVRRFANHYGPYLLDDDSREISREWRERRERLVAEMEKEKKEA